MLIHELPQQPPLSIGGAENGHTMKLFNIMYFLQKDDIMPHFTLTMKLKILTKVSKDKTLLKISAFIKKTVTFT